MKVQNPIYPGRKVYLPIFLLFLAMAAITANAQTREALVGPGPVEVVALPAPTPTCERTIKASVVALDQIIMFNRLGTVNPNGMIYALKQDVVAIDPVKGLVAGNVRLRS